MSIVLDAQQVCKSFIGRPVLNGLDLCIRRGDLVGLIGRNGSGKSTLLNLASGLLNIDSGQIRLFGEDPRCASDQVLGQFVYVPQNQFPLQMMTAPEYLAFLGGFYPRYRPDLACALLTRFEVPPKTVMCALSPGIRQRVEIVRALAMQPALMLLDEPVSAVDPPSRRQLLAEIMTAAQNEGAALLLTTHLLADIERASVEVVTLRHGRVSLRVPIRTLKTRYWLVESDRADRPGFLAAAEQVLPLPGGGWSALVARDALPESLPDGVSVRAPTLEEILLEGQF